ncbi:hypothetical protein OG758_09835 [Streptomyces sp. NBC_01474]|uniref:hypothetical protein n=1 Tax=unclassified Streptomyces TaxID=2593676 RepID=UPI002DDB9688|nr:MULTISPECIES: hypothetical protein [unclassified Streptomyces]WSD94435.1 hypothetical protein OG758_09835 [Streptomyces sp. NBC_01474]
MSDHIALILLACTLALVVAAIVGTGAGYLARRDYATYPTALTRAAVAFAATLNLAAALTTALFALGY